MVKWTLVFKASNIKFKSSFNAFITYKDIIMAHEFLHPTSRFSNKVALITAAGKGIGKTLSLMMGLEGARIVAVDIDSDCLNELSKELQEKNIPFLALKANALDEASAKQTVDQAFKHFGTIDILVNGVGGSTILGRSSSKIDEMELSEFEELLKFNLSGTFLMSRSVLPIMKKQKSGCIVNIASIAARGNAFSNGGYSAAKAGVVALTTKLAMEIAPFGLRCNAIAPGLTMTERMVTALEKTSADEMEKRISQVPLGRFATAEDQAKVICFLASSEADFVTGSTIFVAGGL